MHSDKGFIILDIFVGKQKFIISINELICLYFIIKSRLQVGKDFEIYFILKATILLNHPKKLYSLGNTNSLFLN